MNVNEFNLENANDLVKIIKGIKTKGLSKESIDITNIQPKLSLEEIIEKMEVIQEDLNSVFLESKPSIKSHMEFYLNKSKSFDDPKYERLFQLDNKLVSCPKNTSKMVDYSVRDKLIGFVSKSGHLAWDESKITEFLNSIKNTILH